MELFSRRGRRLCWRKWQLCWYRRRHFFWSRLSSHLEPNRGCTVDVEYETHYLFLVGRLQGATHQSYWSSDFVYEPTYIWFPQPPESDYTLQTSKPPDSDAALHELDATQDRDATTTQDDDRAVPRSQAFDFIGALIALGEHVCRSKILFCICLFAFCVTCSADSVADPVLLTPHSQSTSDPDPVSVQTGTMHSSLRVSGLGYDRLRTVGVALAWLIGLGLTCTLPCMMIPGASVPRMPPSWGPEMQEQYSFRQWSHDILVWSVAVEGDPSRKAALLTMALKGVAAEYIKSLPPAVLINGGMINGNAADPLTFIMHSLAERFSLLGEEVRMSSLTDLFHFRRNFAANEKVDELIARFELVRQRAHDQGQLTISIPGLCWLLLKALEVTDNQLMQLLARTDGRMPVTEAEFAALKLQLRRMGHILEHAPNNIAAALRSSGQGQRPTFLAQPTETQAFVAQPGNPPHSAAWSDVGMGNAYMAQDGYAAQGWGSSGLSHSGWGESSAAAAEPSNAWWTEPDDTWGSDTDTDTASSTGETVIPPETPEGLTDDAAVGEHLFWAYARAKAQWRKFMGRPTRAVRRFTRKFISRKGKGKGKGKGRPNVSAFLAALQDSEVEQLFLGMRKGKGKGKRSSGKGKGRRRNPKGRDGSVMRCFRCGSDTHLSRECHLPRTDGTSSRPSASPQPTTFYTHDLPNAAMPAGGPLDGLIFMASEVPSTWSTEDSSALPEGVEDPWAEYLRNYGMFNASGGQTAESGLGRSTADSSSDPPRPFFGPSASTQARGPQRSGDAQASGASSNPSQGGGANQPFVPPPHVTRLMYEQPPPSLPVWVQLPEFGYVAQGARVQPPQHVPMTSAHLPSQVEGPSTEVLEGIHMMSQATTRRWAGEDMPRLAQMPHVHSTLEPEHRGAMDVLAYAQHIVPARRAEIRGRARRQLRLPTAVDANRYDALDTSCVLCQEVYLENDSVARLACRHVFHTACWADYMMHPQARMECPICRGSARVIARFSYMASYDNQGPASELQSRPPSVDTPPDVSPERPTGQHTPHRRPANFDMSTPPPANSEREDEPSLYQNFESFPWWPTEQILHSTSSHSFQSLLIDPGAYTNLAGLNWVRRMQQAAAKHGLEASQQRLERPMTIQGVGQGSQSCLWSAKVPIALPCISEGQEGVARHSFEAPVVADSGAGLPALLGLKSLREKSAILVLSADDSELRMILPGEEGVNLELNAGAVVFPLLTAPSGHLLLRCDQFEGCRRISLAPPMRTFAADPPVEPELGSFEHGLKLRPPPPSSAAKVKFSSASPKDDASSAPGLRHRHPQHASREMSRSRDR